MSKKNIPESFFGDPDQFLFWKKEWEGMPEFEHEDLTSEQAIIVHFATKEDRAVFSKLIEQNITNKTQSIWFPRADIAKIFDKVYVDETRERKQVEKYKKFREK